LLLWQTYYLILGANDTSPIHAFQDMAVRLFTWEQWQDVVTSFTEVFGGLLVGGLLALPVSIVSPRLASLHAAIPSILSASFLSPILLGLLLFDFVFAPGANSDWAWYRTLFLGVGHKIVAVGFLTFFFFSRALWAFHDAPLLQRWLIAIDDALPIAFVAMLFGELYAATAGLGFQMVVAAATFQHPQALGAFFVTVVLLSLLSAVISFIVRHPGLDKPPKVVVEE
jgi:ABC-type nitrate/sulfonate/bicarbonate transport system permease component